MLSIFVLMTGEKMVSDLTVSDAYMTRQRQYWKIIVDQDPVELVASVTGQGSLKSPFFC